MSQSNQPKINQEQLRRQISKISQELEQFNIHRQNRINQLTALTSYLESLKSAKDTLVEIQKRDPKEKILFPLSSLFFIPVSIREDTVSDILINIRSGIFKKGDIKSAESNLDKEIKTVSETIQTVQQDIDKYSQEIRNRENFLSQFYTK